MNSALNSIAHLNAALLWMEAILAALGGIAMLLVFFVARRSYRQLRIRRYDALAFKLHKQWREIVRGDVSAETWRKDPMQCEIVQSKIGRAHV